MPRATGPVQQDFYYKTKIVPANTLVKQADRGPWDSENTGDS